MIPVTKPFLPSEEDYLEIVKGIFHRNWLTNNGPILNELELRLKSYLDIEHLLYVTNGTIALQMAIKCISKQGEIITTPFSYVATTSSIVWENSAPVFVDIDPESLNIDASKIEDAVTENTVAILGTHVYGNPCSIEAIERVARKHNLMVIYDAAHAFGTSYKERSIFEYGDISTSSFHATKLFHTIEGGAVFARNHEILKSLASMRNFGHDIRDTYSGVGINAKNSEFHAAMGLCVLDSIEDILSRRKSLSARYDEMLAPLNYKKQRIEEHTNYNHAYYPIILEDQETTLKVLDFLNQSEVWPRRYFFPSLGDLPYVKTAEVPNSVDISKRVLCLPLYHALSFQEVDMISRLILRCIRY